MDYKAEYEKLLNCLEDIACFSQMKTTNNDVFRATVEMRLRELKILKIRKDKDEHTSKIPRGRERFPSQK